MKNILRKTAIIISLGLLFTGCPGAPNTPEIPGADTPENQATDTPAADNPEQETVEKTLTERIAQAQESIDFENAEIAQDAVVAKAVTIKNLKLGGKTLTIEATGTELQNVSDAVIIIDEKVGDGDVTLTGCSNITKLVVNGGGSNSIHIKNSKVASVEVKKDAVRVAMEENSEVEALVVDAAATKIESEENIVIKAITVNENVDKVTVKGGTVEKIEVTAPEGDQPAAQIVVDGKADIQSIEGTKDVQLTKEAIQSGSNVVINAPVPVVTYYDDTIVFLSNGDLTGSEFENEDVYYEYIFDVVSRKKEENDMQFKFKIYKLPDSIRLFLSAIFSDSGISTMEVTNNDIPGTIIDSKTLSIKNFVDATLVLKSAGLVKGTFDENRVTLETPVYDQKFDIKDCGIPEEIILPVSPYKPNFTAMPSENGNIITFTFNDSDDKQEPDKYISKLIEVYHGIKEDGKWIFKEENKVFIIDNNKNKSVSFTDPFVTAGKEYAYLYYINRYRPSADEDFVTVTASGGKGEISLSAQNSTEDNGIKLTISDISYSAEYEASRTIFRYFTNDEDERPSYVKINNYIKENELLPIVDYYTENGTSYTYTAQYAYWKIGDSFRYTPIIRPCTIKATVGFGEPKITNSPAGSVNENQIFVFTTVPQIALTQLVDNASYNISFNYVYNYTEGDYTSSDNRTILYDTEHTEAQADINKVSMWSRGTYKYDQRYEVFIPYTNGISYSYIYSKPHTFEGMEDIIR